MARSQPTLRRHKAGNYTWTLRGDASVPDKILEDPDAHLANPTLLIKCSDIVTIGRVPANGVTFILRRLNYRNWRHRLRDVFRPSRAKSAMLRGLALEAAGVPTPRAIGVAERRLLRCPIRAYLLTEEMPRAVSIEYFLRTRNPLPRAAERSLAQTLATLHQAGFSHRDLKSSNILINDKCETALIDLDAVRPLGKFGERRVIDDLIRLRGGIPPISIKPRVFGRFFIHYAAARGLTNPKSLWRRLVNGLQT